jgi:hypothetical protein
MKQIGEIAVNLVSGNGRARLPEPAIHGDSGVKAI